MIQFFLNQDKSKISLAIFLLLIAVNSNAQPGTLDSTFGHDGKVITYLSASYPNMQASAIQDDGKIIFAGENSTADADVVLVLRYLPDGTIDSSFGNNGQVTTDFGEDYEDVTCVAITPDNSIIIGGIVSSGYVNIINDVMLCKYKPDGTPDSSFGENGKTRANFFKDESIYSISLQDDGKIVLGGSASAQFLLMRFTGSGKIDKSFGTYGYIQTSFFGLDFIRSTIVQRDGKILAGGPSGDPGEFIIARYLENGQLDPSFGSAGKVKTDLPDGVEYIYSIALQSDGKIIAGGASGYDVNSIDSKQTMTVARYNTDGILDVSFGKAGYTIVNFVDVNSDIQKILVQPDDKIIALGRTLSKSLGGPLDFALSAFTENGIIDSSFGSNGKVITDFGNFETNTFGFLQQDGKIVLTGITEIISRPNEPVLARYNGLGIEKNKYVRIKQWLHHHGITWQDKPDDLINYYSVQKSTNGNAFTEVARIVSSHNSAVQTYEAAGNSTATYRVAAVSTTGNITYSNTLTLAAGNTIAVKLYPNPAKNNLQIEGLPAGTKTTLTITDLSGNTRIAATANSTTYSLNIAQLTHGNYLLKIKSGSTVVTKQFIKE